LPTFRHAAAFVVVVRASLLNGEPRLLHLCQQIKVLDLEEWSVVDDAQLASVLAR
jgi:hypothetical protein